MTSDFWKSKKISMELGMTKGKKERERERNQDRICVLGRELWKKNVAIPWEVPSQDGRGASETWRTAQLVCVRQNRERLAQMFSTITMHSPVWDTCLPGQAGTECQSWGFAGQTWGYNWDWLHRDSLNGQERGAVTTKGICRRNVGQHLFPEKAMATHSSTLAWKIPWTEEPGRLQFMGSRRSDMTEDFTFTFHFHALEEEMATHSSVLAWRIPGIGEPGGLPSIGSHRVRHDWSDLAAAAAIELPMTFFTDWNK